MPCWVPCFFYYLQVVLRLPFSGSAMVLLCFPLLLNMIVSLQWPSGLFGSSQLHVPEARFKVLC